MKVLLSLVERRQPWSGLALSGPIGTVWWYSSPGLKERIREPKNQLNGLTQGCRLQTWNPPEPDQCLKAKASASDVLQPGGGGGCGAGL